MKLALISTIIFLAITCTTHNSFGQQEFDLPQDIELKTKEDFVKHEATIVEIAKWLEKTDLDKEAAKRTKLNAFVLRYISGSPTITIEVTEPLMKIVGKNAQLLALYLASYARNAIENKETSKSISTKAGLTSIMNVYKRGIQIEKSKEMERIIKMTDGELDSYIADKLK